MDCRLYILLVTFFDTTGTLIGLVQQAGLMKDNKMPRAGEALAADSSGMLVGSVLGTSQLVPLLNQVPVLQSVVELV